VTYAGDSGNRIFVLYWKCPLIRVSVIRCSTVLRNVRTWRTQLGSEYELLAGRFEHVYETSHSIK
jgi:hypothetical protein